MADCSCPYHPVGCYGHPTACECSKLKLAKPVTIKLEQRPDGGLRISSDDVPGLVLSHSNPGKAMKNVIPALRGILEANT